MKLWVDPEKCQGHNRCHALAPRLFDVDELGYSVVLVDEVPAGLEDLALKAVHNCPERAISVVEDDRPDRPQSGGAANRSHAS